MKVLLLDNDSEGMGIDLGVRAREADHEVRYWLPTHMGEELPYGQGLLDRVVEWEKSMDWADLIITVGNSTHAHKMVEYFGKGYPIFGTNQKSAELELDRGVGQEVLKDHGIETAPYQVVDTPEEALDLVRKTGLGYAMKPWGGDADKSMTCVAKDANEAIFTLESWKKTGKFKGQLMMQEKVDGVEMGISGWFGRGGWSAAMEESFEHKKFLNDDLGENTGEMGTVIRHVTKSKLFDMMLEPLTDYLHMVGFVGDCSVNCIIDEGGTPWPLEFTMRLGWPDFCIRQEVIKSDCVEWMYDLLEGRDTLKVSTDVALGVLMCYGDFPKCKDPPGTWMGAPIFGISDANRKHLHFQQMMGGKAPILVGKKITQVIMPLTAGPYVLIAGGSGKSVSAAADKAYEVASEVWWPGNLMYRTDIGDRLRKDLPLVQKHGFATGMKF